MRPCIGLGAGEYSGAAARFAVVVEDDATISPDGTVALEGHWRRVGRDQLLPLDDVEVVDRTDAVMCDRDQHTRPLVADIDDLVEDALAECVVAAAGGENDLATLELLEYFRCCDLCNVHCLASHSRYELHLCLA